MADAPKGRVEPTTLSTIATTEFSAFVRPGSLFHRCYEFNAICGESPRRRSRKFWKVGVGKFRQLGVGVGVGHLLSDSATLMAIWAARFLVSSWMAVIIYVYIFYQCQERLKTWLQYLQGRCHWIFFLTAFVFDNNCSSFTFSSF